MFSPDSSTRIAIAGSEVSIRTCDLPCWMMITMVATAATIAAGNPPAASHFSQLRLGGCWASAETGNASELPIDDCVSVIRIARATKDFAAADRFPLETATSSSLAATSAAESGRCAGSRCRRLATRLSIDAGTFGTKSLSRRAGLVVLSITSGATPRSDRWAGWPAIN